MSREHSVVILLADSTRADQLARRMSEPPTDQQAARRITKERVLSYVARNTDEFYQIVNRQHVDIVIIDYQLPGFLNGLEMLERLYKDLLRPDTVLLVDLESKVCARAKESGVDLLVSAGEDISSLTDMILARLANRSGLNLRIPPLARMIVRQSDTINTLPQLLTKLATYLDDEDASTADLAKDIAIDPKITSELLKLANSAAMGHTHKLEGVYDAVNYLGIRRTISLAISSTFLSSNDDMIGALPGDIRPWYNTRSVLIAATASSFASRVGNVSPETAFVLGLLQDIGLLVLAQHFGERYLLLLDRNRKIGHLRLAVSELNEFGITHADVSAALLQKWEMPQPIVSMVLDHHSGGVNPSESKSLQASVRLMQIGEAVADLADNVSPQRRHVLNGLLSGLVELTPDDCKGCMIEAVARSSESSRLFSVPLPDKRTLHLLTDEVASARSGDIEGGASPAVPDGRENEPARTGPGETASTGKHHPGTTILVLNNDSPGFKMIKEYLAPTGYLVVWCREVREAQQKLSKAAAVLCDVKTDASNGIGDVEKLRRSGFKGPIIMLSDDRRRPSVVKSIEAGVNDYLVKPCSRDQLLARLAKHIKINCPA